VIEPIYRLSFIGDIMDLGHKYLEVSPAVKDFIKDSDFLIGNLEATINGLKKKLADLIGPEQEDQDGNEQD
jgi:hypothetical protein